MRLVHCGIYATDLVKACHAGRHKQQIIYVLFPFAFQNNFPNDSSDATFQYKL